MNNEPQSGKRIVSRGEYTRVQTRKMWLWFEVAVMSFAGAGIVFILIRKAHHGMSFIQVGAGMFLMPFVLFAYWYVRQTTKEIHAIKPVALLTRANTADLPAPDSLVRASSPPVQAQETVLLRASREMQDKHEEQLLRATVGGQE